MVDSCWLIVADYSTNHYPPSTNHHPLTTIHHPQNVNKSCRLFSSMLHLFTKIATEITQLPSLRFSFVWLNQSICLFADNTAANEPPNVCVFISQTQTKVIRHVFYVTMQSCYCRKCQRGSGYVENTVVM